MSRELLAYLYGFLTDSRIEKMEEVLANRTRHLTVVLEDIYQSQNASAVVRTCDCFGIQDLHVIENKYEYTLNPKVVMGASKWVDIHQHNTFSDRSNTPEAIKALRAKGYKIVATSPHAKSVTPDSINLEDKLAIFFGTELDGLSQDVLDEADEHLKIPMFGFTESFNISVSVSLCLSHLVNRLHETSLDWRLSDEELLSLNVEWAKKSVKNGQLHIDNFLSGQGAASK